MDHRNIWLNYAEHPLHHIQFTETMATVQIFAT